jgi:phospholipid/cholesterol/gamma-HCH transport system permease protein
MKSVIKNSSKQGKKLTLFLEGEFSLYNIELYQKNLQKQDFKGIDSLEIDLTSLHYFDTASAIFLVDLVDEYAKKNIALTFTSLDEDHLKTITLVKKKRVKHGVVQRKKSSYIQRVGKSLCSNYLGLLSFLAFLGKLFATKLHYLLNPKNIRIKEIIYEINESGVRALGIVALTSFLIGLVVAYQSAFQLKTYGANIFVVDMLGISILRELAPLITAIVIAGRSGSAFTAQIGAMKITEELDAMRTMGFDPYMFLVLPRILALMIVMPLLIFVADMMGIIGGMFVANIDLNITPQLFLERFNEVVAFKHFLIGLVKGPFFAFLIATIGIYRGMMVKDDTQSIGFNTTKSVVEAIFAVIVCDALFSIAFTNLGI